MNPKKMIFTSETSDDWTWPLRIPVAAGAPMPFEYWMFYHANTILPLRAKMMPEVANA